MSRFLEAFEVYNKNKHAPGDAKSRGGNHSNIGTGNTAFMFAREYRGPSTSEKKDAAAAALAADVKAGKVELVNEPGDASSRKSSVSSESMGAAEHMVDVSKLSREEFEALYNKMKPAPKGEPNNLVNF